MALPLPLASDAKTPIKQRKAKMIKLIFKLCRKNTWFSGVIWDLPMLRDNTNMTIPILSSWPIVRIVANVAEAIP